MHPAKRSDAAERWYEFEQHETFTRPIYVKAVSLREARRLLYSGSLDTEVVPDYPPNNPDMKLGGRGRIAKDQDYVDGLARDSGEGRR